MGIGTKVYVVFISFFFFVIMTLFKFQGFVFEDIHEWTVFVEPEN